MNKRRRFRQLHERITQRKYLCPRLRFHPLYTGTFIVHGTIPDTGSFRQSHHSEAMPVVRSRRYHEGWY